MIVYSNQSNALGDYSIHVRKMINRNGLRNDKEALGILSYKGPALQHYLGNSILLF